MFIFLKPNPAKARFVLSHLSRAVRAFYEKPENAQPIGIDLIDTKMLLATVAEDDINNELLQLMQHFATKYLDKALDTLTDDEFKAISPSMPECLLSDEDKAAFRASLQHLQDLSFIEAHVVSPELIVKKFMEFDHIRFSAS